MVNNSKIHIGIFGEVNSGKSTLFNTLVGENIAIVSSVEGTTTDAVYKTSELDGVGAVVYVDTAGFSDFTSLSQEKMLATKNILEKVDVAILVLSNKLNYNSDYEWIEYFKSKDLPYVVVYNVIDNVNIEGVKDKFNDIVVVNAKTGVGLENLLDKLRKIKPIEHNKLFNNLVKKGDVVLLVMPQDIGAPNNRLILPQSMAIRELIDIGAIGICVDLSTIDSAIEKYGHTIDLVVTDSSVFSEVYKKCNNYKLTSFSVLFAGLKGDINTLISGANAVDNLCNDAKILILEACSHITSHEDIGQVKIPKMLKSKLGDKIKIDFMRNANISEIDFSVYDLVVHCGGCMMTNKVMKNRLNYAKVQNVPITNYGILIAKCNGILDKIVY